MAKTVMPIKQKIICVICFVCCMLMQMVGGNMLAFRNLCLVQGPVEGADKKGHAIVVEKLGMIGDKVYGTPIYAYWSSSGNHSSPCLGYGWHLPIAESCIVPLDANSFEMRRPDGGVELIVRDRKDKSKLWSRRYWQGEVRGEEIRIYTRKDCRHGQSELLFRNGRLIQFKDGNINAMLSYRGRQLESIAFDGKEVLRLDMMSFKGEKRWQIRLESGKPISFIKESTFVPLSSGKKMTVSTLTGIAFPDGSRRTITYDIDTNGNGTVKTEESSIVWNAKRRTILAKDGWTYEVKDPQPEWNNVPIRRFNKKGEAEGEYYDIKTGLQTTEINYSKTVMCLFTSGPLKGKARWSESYYKGELQGRGEYSYDENGGLVYSKGFDQYSSSTNGKKDILEKWFEPNGHILKTRKNGDDSTVQEYIYTPKGQRVAVICGDKIVAECVGNAKEFVAWHKAKQRGENVSVPKVVEWCDVPLPEHMRKAIPPDLLKELKDDGW